MQRNKDTGAGRFRKGDDEEEYSGLTSPSARERMVQQLMERGIRDPRVLEAMRLVERHRFVDEALASQSYSDATLPIGEGQTLSQPYTVAVMSEALKLRSGDHVLEVGTGSGYQAAVLSRLCFQVYTVERLPNLALVARKRLRNMGFHNIIYRVGDGSLGWPEKRRFDRIIVTAGAPAVPNRLALQLVPGGILVAPEGDSQEQRMVRWTALGRPGLYKKEELGSCRFVPLVGAQGWDEPRTRRPGT